MAYDPATAAMAETLEQFNIGASKGGDVPKERKWRTWTDEDRKRYFKWDSIALPIPITNKRDLHQFGDLLKGLGTKLQYLAARGDLDDRGSKSPALMRGGACCGQELGSSVALTTALMDFRSMQYAAAARQNGFHRLRSSSVYPTWPNYAKRHLCLSGQ